MGEIQNLELMTKKSSEIEYFVGNRGTSETRKIWMHHCLRGDGRPWFQFCYEQIRMMLVVILGQI